MRKSRFSGKKRYLLIFIMGMMVFLYPTFSNYYYNHITMGSLSRKAPNDITLPKNSAGEGSTKVTVRDKEFQEIGSDPEMKFLLNKELSYLREYNKKLWNIPGLTLDPFEEKDGDNNKLKTSSDAGAFAYIKISRINQTLPVYLGATAEHLKKGAAVIQGTSIPVGGENTNSVIAGHTGLVQRFFTDLPELKPGDEISITNPWGTLYYKVTGNKIIWPNQEEYLSVVPGKDMITLLTCYHGTTKNDRLLVFAERYYPEEKTGDKVEEKKEANSYSYISEVQLKAKPWYEKPQTFVVGGAVMLLGLFLYAFFK